MLEIDLCNDAARAAYLAGFHAAQALVFERTGRALKTHEGVHTELHRLTKDDPRFTPPLKRFLSVAYEFKVVADDEVGPDAYVGRDDAESALRVAETYVAVIAKYVGETEPG